MRSVRVGTVVWGAILLVLAAVAFSVAVFDLREFQAAAVIWVTTGLGGVFVLAAIIALIARAVSSGTAEPEPEPELPANAGAEPVAPAKAGKSTGATAKKGQPVD